MKNIEWNFILVKFVDSSNYSSISAWQFHFVTYNSCKICIYSSKKFSSTRIPRFSVQISRIKEITKFHYRKTSLSRFPFSIHIFYQNMRLFRSFRWIEPFWKENANFRNHNHSKLISKNLKKIPTNHFSNRIKTSKGILQNFATHGPIPVITYRPDRLHFPWYLGIRSTERYRETREETALPVFRCSRNIPRSNSYIGGERERGQANGSRRDTVIYAIPVAGRCVSTVCARV